MTTSAGQHPVPPQQLLDYLSGKLDDETCAVLDQHVSDCADCCQMLDELCGDHEPLIRRMRAIYETNSNAHGITSFDTSTKHPGAFQTPLPEADDRPLAGRHGHFEIFDEVGRGGMGVVYAGHDTVLDRPVVVKILGSQASTHRDAVERFVKEAKIGGNLLHPGVVPIFELSQTNDGRPFFVMRRIEGQSLDKLLSQRTSSHDNRTKLLNVFLQVCQTVAYAHSKQIIHRDLKPQNIMLGHFGEVQVLDWGIAKQLASSTAELSPSDPQNDNADADANVNGANVQTRAGRILGTPLYMAPEQALGKTQFVDKRSDVFALGAILFEILAGEPLRDRSGCDVDALRNNRFGQFDLDHAKERLQLHVADEELVEFCLQCVSQFRDNRPADAHCVAVAMEDYIESNDRRIRQTEILAERQKAVLQERFKRRVVVLLACLVSTLLLAALAIGYAVHQRHVAGQQTQLLAAAQQNRQLTDALQEQLDDSERTLTLAGRHNGPVLTELQSLFAEVALPTNARDEVRRLARSASAPLSALDQELLRRLYEAHLWSVTFASDARQNICWDEAIRQYDATLIAFADLPLGSADLKQLESRLAEQHPVVRQAILDALADSLLLRTKQPDANQAYHAEWFQRVLSRFETSPVRQAIHDAQKWNDPGRMAKFLEPSVGNTLSAADAYFLVKALEQAGQMADAMLVLREARTNHADSIWLNGRILPDDKRRLTSVRQSAANNQVRGESAVALLFEARADMRSKNYAPSLEKFRWIFRTNLPDASLPDRALSGSLVFWTELGRVYAPAAAEFDSLCDSARQIVLDSEQTEERRRLAFQTYVAATSATDQFDSATSLFSELVEASDPLSPQVVSLVQSHLSPDQFAQFEQRFPDDRRAFPKFTSVRTTPAMGDERQQFVTLLTLIAMQQRIGKTSEAHAIAADAARIWNDAQSQIEIDAALQGQVSLRNQQEIRNEE
ncbi:MAG: serine/threonine-protein kinase [Pirellulaceae bacterium]